MRFLAPIVLAALGAVTVSGSAAAAPLVVPIDQSTRLNVAGSAASVLVGNPQIADVTVIDSHTLYILGRGYGATDLVVLDQAGRPLYTSDLVVSSNDAGRVSVYRGADRTDMACAPACHASLRSTSSGGASASAPTGGGSASGGGMAGAIGGLTGSVASGASSAGSAFAAPASSVATSTPAPR